VAELFTNGARGRLLNGISAVDTSLTLRSGQGALFPTFGVGDFSWLVLEQGPAANPTKREIVRAGPRSGDAITILRAQQGTIAQAFDPGARVEIRLTAATLASFQDVLGYNRMFLTGAVLPQNDNAIGVCGAMQVGTPTTHPGVTPDLTSLGRSIPREKFDGSGNSDYPGTGTADQGRIGVRGTPPNIGGMEILARFMIETNILGSRKFLGLSNIMTTNRFSALNPSGRTSDAVVGIGQEDSTPVSGNWQLYHSAGAGSVTQVDTGVPKVVGNLCQLRIWSPRGVARWYVELIDFEAGTRFFTSLTTNIPDGSTGMIFVLACRGITGVDGISLHSGWSFQW
jgi:hypothetical protein